VLRLTGGETLSGDSAVSCVVDWAHPPRVRASGFSPAEALSADWERRMQMGWSALSSSKTAASDSSTPGADTTAGEGGKAKGQRPAAPSSGGVDGVVRGAVVEGEEDEEDEDDQINEASSGATAERSRAEEGGSGMVAGSMAKSLSGAWAALVPSEETVHRSKALLASATASAAVLPSLAFSRSGKGSGEHSLLF